MTNTNCIYHRKEKTFHSYRFAQQIVGKQAQPCVIKQEGQKTMGDKIYTRTGIVRPIQQENNNRGYNNQFYQDRDLKLRTYRFPLHENNTLEIRLTIPEGATKDDMLEAVEHMKVAAGFME